MDDEPVTVDTIVRDVKNLPRQKCFREALMWGIGLSTLFAVHRYRQGATVLRACDSYAVSFVFVSCGTWALCRRDQANKAASMLDFKGDKRRAPSIPSFEHVEVPEPAAPTEAAPEEVRE